MKYIACSNGLGVDSGIFEAADDDAAAAHAREWLAAAVRPDEPINPVDIRVMFLDDDPGYQAHMKRLADEGGITPEPGGRWWPHSIPTMNPVPEDVRILDAHL
jgi:hypothetical protein